jgi:aminoglycoside phosphotransferase (APT) family kinase protein
VTEDPGIDDAVIAEALTAWLRDQGGWGSDVQVDALQRPSVGYASNTYLVDLIDPVDRIVLRLPPDRDTHLGETLRRQVRVQNALSDAGLPAPAPALYEPDDRRLGRPFLVMPCVDGHVGGEVPAIDAWVMASTPEQQAVLYRSFTDGMADLHRFDWRAASDLRDVLRGRDDRAVDHVAYWRRYLDWATDGAAPVPVVAALDRCHATAPDRSDGRDPPPSLLWGDARLGNAIFDDDRLLVAMIDWETACLGPAELDVGYWLGLEAVLDEIMGTRPAGFPDRAETLARYGERLGRPLVDLDWYETLGLLSATCISARLTVLKKGRAPTEAELASHPVLARVEHLQVGA